MTNRTKPKTIRPVRHQPNAFKAFASPSPAQIREKLQPLQQPMTAAQADAVLAKNGVPPAEEARGQATGLCKSAACVGRKALELFGEALIAVVAPLLTAAVDGLGILVAAVTVWELWKPTEALADRLLAWLG